MLWTPLYSRISKDDYVQCTVVVTIVNADEPVAGQCVFVKRKAHRIRDLTGEIGLVAKLAFSTMNTESSYVEMQKLCVVKPVTLSSLA